MRNETFNVDNQLDFRFLYYVIEHIADDTFSIERR